MANKKVSQLVSKPSVLVTDLFPIADPTTGQLYKTTISDLGTAIGSGVSSVNTLVGAVVLDTDDIQELASPTNRWFTDTRARAALSASAPLAYNSGTGVFSIPQATGSQNGYLTSTDWTTFNAKQAALSGTGFVKISGTTISYDNSTYLTTSAAASTYLALTGGTLTGALNGTSATFTGDLTLSASNPRLYLTDTDNNPDYFISNTDGTFTIYDVTNSTSRLTISTLNTILNTNLRVDGDVLIKQDSVLGGVSGYTAIASDTDGIFLKLGTASAHAYLVLSSLTNYRNFTFPDATGTLALTSDLSAYLPLTGGVLSGSIRSTGYFLTGMTSGSGALYYSSGSNRVTVANYNTSGIVTFEVNGGSTALTLNANLSATFASTLSATGATLTGALSGTSATFSSSVTVGASTNGRLGVRGTTNDSSAFAFEAANSSGNTLFIVRNDGVSTFTSNVGIGTFSPSDRLNVVVGSNGNAVRFDGPTSGLIFQTNATTTDIISYGGSTPAYRALNFSASASTNMTITTAGNVGIGTTAPNGKLEVSADQSSNNQHINIIGTQTSFNQGYSIGIPTSTKDLRFYDLTAGSERMRINSGGQVGINTASFDFGEKLGLYSTSSYTLQSKRSGTGSEAHFAFSNANGAVGSIFTNGSTTFYNATSDYRLKEDLQPIKGLEIVNKIKVYDYQWKSDKTRMDGVLAHELAEVLPYAVTGVKDAKEMQSVDYSKIVPVMVQAIKDLKQELDTLKNK